MLNNTLLNNQQITEEIKKDYFLSRHYYKIDNASAIFNNRDNVSVHWELINVCV